MKRSANLLRRGMLLKGKGWGDAPDRSGVALILVVGLLALMVVMAVTFSIFMRTERVAAGSFRNDVAARQLLQVALNRAIEEINRDVGDRPYPDWFYLAPGGTNAAMVPGVTNAPAMEWIPRAALGTNLNPTVRWWPELPSSNCIEGRIGFLVVNCSGLLDANYTGTNGITRGIGTNVNEIQLSGSPNVADAGVLVSNRPYETIQELGEVSQVSGALSMPVSDFVCFSYFPTGYVGGTNFPLFDLSGDETALAARYAAPPQYAGMINALVQSGVDASQAGFVFSNLLDYVDANNEPRDLGSACTESVPMFNEVAVSNSYAFKADGTFSMRGRVSFEWFYPFVKPSTHRYWIEYHITFERTAGTPAGFPMPANLNGAIDAGYPDQGSKLPAVCPSVSISIPPNTAYTNFLGASVSINAKVSLMMHSDSASGPLVDATPYPSSATLDLALPTVSVPASQVARIIDVSRDAEAIDPRFNWAASQWRIWPTFNNTLGRMNNITLTNLQNRATDGYADMFVADRPLLSVTELTYLLRGARPVDYWNTIRLYDRTAGNGQPGPLDRILDHFVVLPVAPPKGFVNPNSSIQGALMAVFRDLPIKDYPDAPPAATYVVSPAEAASLAAFWVDTNQNLWLGSFTNLSDIGHATNVFGTGVLSGLSPFQQESFFRHTAGLFSTRQQYYMILLFAETTKVVPLVGTNTIVGVRGLAEVWRDAFANAEGRHPCLIRMFKVLENE